MREAVFFHKLKGKFFWKTEKILLTSGGIFDILSKRLCESRAYYAMKREIAGTWNPVTSVEYVRCRAVVPADNRAAEQNLHERISPVRDTPASMRCRFVFRAGFDTHGTVYGFSLIRANPQAQVHGAEKNS